jgi:hypothetical protein
VLRVPRAPTSAEEKETRLNQFRSDSPETLILFFPPTNDEAPFFWVSCFAAFWVCVSVEYIVFPCVFALPDVELYVTFRLHIHIVPLPTPFIFDYSHRTSDNLQYVAFDASRVSEHSLCTCFIPGSKFAEENCLPKLRMNNLGPLGEWKRQGRDMRPHAEE